MVGGTVLAGVLVLPVTLVVGYYVAVVTTRFGLDPDNHRVPPIPASVDLTGVVGFVFVMSVLGVTSMDESEPKNVKDLLVELKDASELMVDLAYAAGLLQRGEAR